MKTAVMTANNFIDLTLYTQYVYEIRYSKMAFVNDTIYKNVITISENHPEYGVSRIVIKVLK
jgi:hypothetical protein